jgi:hypothetical protein
MKTDVVMTRWVLLEVTGAQNIAICLVQEKGKADFVKKKSKKLANTDWRVSRFVRGLSQADPGECIYLPVCKRVYLRIGSVRRSLP